MNQEPLKTCDMRADGEALEARLAAIERAYEDLLERVRRYERERADIRTRLERLLARIGSRIES
jgi:predicted  nucleic acid-binding Zn-ribbon protein